MARNLLAANMKNRLLLAKVMWIITAVVHIYIALFLLAYLPFLDYEMPLRVFDVLYSILGIITLGYIGYFSNYLFGAFIPHVSGIMILIIGVYLLVGILAGIIVFKHFNAPVNFTAENKQILLKKTFRLAIIAGVLSLLLSPLFIIPGVLTVIAVVIEWRNCGFISRNIELLGTRVTDSPTPSSLPSIDIDALSKLGQLKNAGLLSDEEFELEKKKLM